MSSINARIQSKSDTTENWRLASINNGFTGLKGEIIVFTDYESKTNADGTITYIPGIKISDGKSYIIDQPFVSDDIRDEIMNHINNSNIHVTSEEKANWNSKISVKIENEQMVFY